ncbi:MAG: aminopeptidase [Peptostreptococcaceae bacterium]|nr:aminopeptidase [Peptostreptococcaceae bacterium]
MQKNLEKYARLLVRKGINIQKDQLLVVRAPMETREFVHLIAKEAYDAGAKNVHVEYSDDKLNLIRYQKAPLESFGEALQWKADGFEQMAKDNAAFLSITGTDPDLLKGVDPEKIALNTKTQGESMKNFRKIMMNSEASWCVAAVPSPAWAKKVYPDLSEEEAVEKLWDSIFKMTRSDLEDPVTAWNDHIIALKDRVKKLQDYNFKTLHYKSAVTDLMVDLAPNHVWISAEEKNAKGTTFIANMPTEEIFTAARRDGVNGYVSNTMPFNYSGTLIDGFKLTFKDGKIVEMSAKVGEEVFEKLLNTDEGARYLGEVALVPYDSPISNTNTIYFNTLFDENASCHFAFGAAYPTNVKGGDKMTQDELKKAELNVSMVHEDFMVGSADMNIDGITHDGQVIPVFRDGNWAL